MFNFSSSKLTPRAQDKLKPASPAESESLPITANKDAKNTTKLPTNLNQLYNSNKKTLNNAKKKWHSNLL